MRPTMLRPFTIHAPYKGLLPLPKVPTPHSRIPVLGDGLLARFLPHGQLLPLVAPEVVLPLVGPPASKRESDRGPARAQRFSATSRSRGLWVLAPYFTKAAGATHKENSRFSLLLIVTELIWPHTIACAISPELRTQGRGGGARGTVGRRGAARGGGGRHGAA